ncbi:hypothetical protein EDB19DRAFT_1691773 [Suillus lakei]|nr:hypothetical protein EDB19DRAFT_1691773 [Suillus lakei]
MWTDLIFFVCLLVHLPHTQTVMPHPNKAAAQARAKRWAGKSMFVPVKVVSDSENIVSLQELYAVFLSLCLKQHNLPQAKK